MKLRLDALASRNRKPLPDWATEQLRLLAADAEEIPATTYTAEWMGAFGSIVYPSFNAPERSLPAVVEPLDGES